MDNLFSRFEGLRISPYLLQTPPVREESTLMTAPLFDMVLALLQDVTTTERSQRLRATGADLYAQSVDPYALTAAGIQAAQATNIDGALVVTDLLLGYAAAREDGRTRHWERHLLRRVQQLDGLHRVISAANSTLDLDASLQTVVETVAEVMQVDACSVFLFDQHLRNLCLRATYGLSPRAIGQVVIQLGEGITGWAGEIGKPVMIEDVLDEPRYQYEPMLGEERFRSLLCVPIILFASEKHSVESLQGVLTVQTREPYEFSADQIAYVEVVAGELALSVANAQLYQQTDKRLHQKIRELATLQRVTAALTSTLDLDMLLGLIVEQAVRISNVDRAEVYHVLPSNRARLAAGYGTPRHGGVDPLIAQVIKERRPIAVPNAYTDERWPIIQTLAYNEGYHSLFAMPLRTGQRITGALCFYSYRERHVDYEQLQLLNTFADEAAIALENARLYEETQRNLALKSTLLQEIHHRIRNNLQTILALLKMQLRRLETNTPGYDALEESVRRVEAISAVHNLLSRDDLGTISVQDIARQVADNLQITTADDVRLTFEVTGEPVLVRSRAATLLAIVINELVGNARDHGLSHHGGIIGIDAWRTNGSAFVQVRDDGPRHPRGQQRQSTGLGLQLIETLVTTDLGGRFEFKRDDQWTRAIIEFMPEDLEEV